MAPAMLLTVQPGLVAGSGVARRGSRRATLRVRASDQSPSDRPPIAPPAPRSRRDVFGLAITAAVLLQAPNDARATGLESMDMTEIPQRNAEELAEIQAESRAKLKEADTAFENSELLATLKARSEANKDKNAKELSSKYCMRQAELGIGDCGGLRYIPGATKNGKQKTPKWLQKVLGVEMDQADVEIKF